MNEHMELEAKVVQMMVDDLGYDEEDAILAILYSGLECAYHEVGSDRKLQLTNCLKYTAFGGFVLATCKQWPEGEDYWKALHKDAFWIRKHRLGVWRSEIQKGEMAWGQPKWLIPVLREELFQIEAGTLQIGQATTVTRDLNTGARKRNRRALKVSTTLKDGAIVWIVQSNNYNDVVAAANWFGDRLPASFYEAYSHILVLN